MRQRPRLLLIAAALLIGALAVGGLTVYMGDDDDAESRRPAALGETPPEDPEESPDPVPRKLSVTVAHETNTSGYALPQLVTNGRLTASTSSSCHSAAQPGTTCTWEYLPQCPPDPPCDILTVDLAARPAAGAGVVWTGCSSPTPTAFTDQLCKVALPDDRSVKATVIKTAVRKLSLTVVDQVNRPGRLVKQWSARYGRRNGASDWCGSAAPPGRTCTWEYSQNACPVDAPNCTLEVRLNIYQAAGERIGWTGCSSTTFSSSTNSICVVPMPGDGSVTATVAADPKAATG